MPIRVAVVEDNDRIREGLATIVDGSSGFECTLACGSGEEALRRMEKFMERHG